MHNLGALHESGVGVRKDPREARRLYANAAERGHAKAAEALRVSRRAARWTSPGMGTGRDGDAASASPRRVLRRQLAAKEKETPRLAKELGESKAECGRLKSTVADLRGAVREHEKEAARLRAEASRPASPATGARSRPRGGARVHPQHEPHQQPIRLLQLLRPVRGVGAVRGGVGRRKPRGDGDGDGERERERAARAVSTVSGPSAARRRRPNREGENRRERALRRVRQTRDGRGETRGEESGGEGNAQGAQSRGVFRASGARGCDEPRRFARGDERDTVGGAEGDDARNLQLEELLRKVGVDPDDPAIECELTPSLSRRWRGTTCRSSTRGGGGRTRGRTGNGRQARTSRTRRRRGRTDGEGDAVAVAALPSPGSGDAR